ncbi:permease of the drug/metabolite transporter (DMT) superfamily [Sulfuriferula multivorans]|uniref:Permease of the drug/metabolite transporter (DMT) superfamily n=2 Tax=Sulfuriferula multivorans TaxID=1559896 RepID=A0A401JB68_9PROT|nr:permease of the drug/metabolite transporter (DMT) superfamily [Sulfuriferula multivorans]
MPDMLPGTQNYKQYLRPINTMSIPAAYLGVILIWSTTPLAIQWSGVGADFMFPLLVRMLIGLVACLVLMRVLRISMVRSRAALNAYVAAGTGIFGAMLLVYWGARYVPSGLIAVLFGLIPLFTGLIGMVINDAERLTPAKLAGIVLGLAGLVVIFGAGAKIGAQALPGIAAILCAVAIQAASLVWVKRTGVALPVLALTTGALTLVVGLLLPLWLVLFGQVPQWSMRAGLSTLYLGIFGSVAGFTLYFYVTKHLQAGQVALITLITPVSALLLGQTLNGERPGADVWLGTVLILLGLGMHQWRLLVRMAR